LSTESREPYLRFEDDIAAMNDLFSASWIMNLKQFKAIDIDRIATVEDACFQPFRQNRNDVRMTRDWLEFCVEHMSKWWKTINIFHHKETLKAFINTLDRFGHEPAIQHPQASLRNTISIVAFMAYRSGKNTGQGQLMTVAMLNACLRSMSRYGMGRVVIVVPTESDRDVYQRIVPNKVGETDVVFRVVTKVKTRFIETNMPYAAIVALQEAFESDVDDWLGGETRWDSVYLTEPDTLLHVKPNALDDLVRGVLKKDWILTPHRLQPIPHQSDFSECFPNVVLVPDNQDHQVQTIDSYSTCCIDSGDERPPYESCNNFWYLCGFGCGDHSRLEPYDMMRLTHGLGITMLMGSVHGRQCHVAPSER